MPAVIANCPMVLSQAVKNPQPGPPRMALQWYSAPAVGYALASSAMLQATSRVITETRSHPPTTPAGPPQLRPHVYWVTAPVRIEMIENERAKLPDPPRRRRSGWA